MRQTRFRLLLTAAAVLRACTSLGQDPLMNILKMSYTDVAETKRKAEAGDKAAQLSLGDTFASQNRPSDALEWKRPLAALTHGGGRG
jgi:hypothetical protein